VKSVPKEADEKEKERKEDTSQGSFQGNELVAVVKERGRERERDLDAPTYREKLSSPARTNTTQQSSSTSVVTSDQVLNLNTV